MNTRKQTKTQKIEQLKKQLTEALAGQAHVYHFADAALDKASVNSLMGSGVVLTVTVLGGREIISPTLIRNGLSSELIAALRADLVRSYEDATSFKPKG